MWVTRMCAASVRTARVFTAAVLIASGASVAQSPQVTTGLTPPVQLTRDQDHQRLMDLLHITEMRRGPDGDPTSPHAANFDESKVEPYTLPNPLVLKNGQRVTSAELWWKARRPQIVADFDNEMYGHVPANVPKVTWEVVRKRHETVGNVAVISKDLVGHVDNSAYPLISVDIQMTLTTPEHATGPVPVMLEFGVSPEVLGTMRKRFTEAQWAAYMGPGPGWQSLVLEKGWGYAILIPTSVQADNGEGLTQGIIGLTNKGQPRQPGDWGALRAWAWGASRALDYFETDSSVDAHQVGIEGLSRYGKATLVTMAYEPRFAIAFVGSSGEVGAKLSRRTFGEQVENIASSSEYHWMAGNFLKYGGPLTRNDLPVDAHELIALCAPRPVFVSSGAQAVEGGWVDAKGMFLAAVGAGPVYKLLHKKDLGTSEFPPMETALIDGDIAFRQHRYGHTTGPNWPTFLTFASRYIKGPAEKGSAHSGQSPGAVASSGTRNGQSGGGAVAGSGALNNDGSEGNSPVGIFDDQSDIGAVVPPGTGTYDASTNTYTLTSAGANTWYHVDDFHYLWKKASGDLVLTADITFPPATYNHEPNPHRKGILMFRQSLDNGGAYVDVGAHGSGLTALQYRRALGANTEDIELDIAAPKTVRLEKHGDTFTLFLSMKGEPLHQVGASVSLHLEEPFFVGLGAVSHDVSTTDKVAFSNVKVEPATAETAQNVALYSTLRTIQIEDQFRRAAVIRTGPAFMHSANWSPADGANIYAYEAGRIERIPYHLDSAAGGTPQAVDVGNLVGCSGNYGLSPDGRWFAVSCAQKKGGQHDVYLVAAHGGGAPRKVTDGKVSSYFHAWSPDSQIIAFTRGSAGKADIFTIRASGGPETRLTSDTVNDGPDYTPDGKLIYFDSARSGSTQIWRMKADGSEAEQITAEDSNINSSPHVSPDGKTVAFLSQPASEGSLGIGEASIKVFGVHDGLVRTVTNFQGDRGSFQMYGWGDNNHVAFVSYQVLRE